MIVHKKRRTYNTYANITEITYKVHQRHHQSRHKLRFPSAVIKTVIYTFKFFFCLFNSVIYFYNIVTGINFFNMTVNLT